ncbi:single-stranded DNA-binding protein [Gordonia sp. HY285]|uniref:single-stranded DNA-binding protein n=1 Tax=Gordonia liuliyuniae TaxID=2911517 RepID=UPI001F35E9F3|nr:single-stranded DNA-binding protein [Gordonia liuliyuniae]MCF8610048.1 single-stranded DNA-binding protein [Gordonia liuliyuniae]
MTDTIITVVGNLTADPELRFTPSGAPVVNFTVASTPRSFDKQTNDWKDGEALFLRCSIWRDYAENIAESLKKGMQVIVQGKLKQRSWEKDGERRTSVELEATDVGPTLRFATADVTRKQGGGRGSSRGAATSTGPADDPWGSAPAGGYSDTEPPF